MKKILLFGLIVVLVSISLIFPEKLGKLPGTLNPEMVVVSDSEVFSLQGAEIFIYSLKDLTLTRKIGKKGLWRWLLQSPFCL